MPDGGTTGQVLVKVTNADQDTAWSTLPEIDAQTSTSSTNAVENQAITNYVDGIEANLQNQIDALGEPFRVKQFLSTGEWTIPSVTTDPANTAIPKFVLTITGDEAADFAFAGMIAYEVFDAVSGGNRLNFMPVCQFLGQNQTELSIRGCVMGASSKVAKRISCWALLKHR